jgi:hypothetical protein
MTNDPYTHLAARIDAIVDELDQIAFDDLRAASAAGEPRPDHDRRAMRARRSLEKAAELLRGRRDQDEPM